MYDGPYAGEVLIKFSGRTTKDDLLPDPNAGSNTMIRCNKFMAPLINSWRVAWRLNAPRSTLRIWLRVPAIDGHPRLDLDELTRPSKRPRINQRFLRLIFLGLSGDVYRG